MDVHIVNEWSLAIVTAFAVLCFWAYRSTNARLTASEAATSERIKKAEDATAALALHVAEDYVSVKRFEAYTDRFDEVAKLIFEKLDNVRDKLDTKADKQ
ncbi:hypothetical protein [Paraburkholderia phosphatilytica]|uniref:hypothetical protein n=1 Tax=Paraburkholderia phosphatilytica TaxID=2282883 RepID=UPI000E4CDE64|nr:hypothetical protein [Paraburkholderia phosphatilytica]